MVDSQDVKKKIGRPLQKFCHRGHELPPPKDSQPRRCRECARAYRQAHKKSSYRSEDQGHCRKGHERTAANVLIKGKHTYCVTCMREAYARRRESIRQHAAELRAAGIPPPSRGRPREVIPPAPIELRMALLEHAKSMGLPEALGKPRDINRKYIMSDEARQRASERRLTECTQGHPYEEDSFWIKSDGARICKACARIRRRAGRKRVQACRLGHKMEGANVMQLADGKRRCRACHNTRSRIGMRKELRRRGS